MSFLQTPSLERLSKHPPVILIGMHRSGTSLTGRLLAQLGVHLGEDTEPVHIESRHFQQINRRTLHAAGGAWNELPPVLRALESADFVETCAQDYRANLFAGLGGVRYWGLRQWITLRRGGALPRWGWKDPRTSLTLPIWLRLFPDAQVIHIIRNGIDVAISLHRRQLKQAQRWRVHPDHRDPRGYDIRFCFSLWEQYQRYLLTFRETVPAQQYTELRYETLLREPEPTLQHILARIDLTAEAPRLAEAISMINAGRLDNRAYAAAYTEVLPEFRANPLMRELGYSEENH